MAETLSVEHYYSIVAQYSDGVFDVRERRFEDGAGIVQWGWGGGRNQQFRIARADDGSVKIVARHSGKCIEIENGSTSPGARVVQGKPDARKLSQNFRLEEATENELFIRSLHSKLQLEIEGGSPSSGAPVAQGTFRGEPHQRFQFSKIAAVPVVGSVTVHHGGEKPGHPVVARLRWTYAGMTDERVVSLKLLAAHTFNILADWQDVECSIHIDDGSGDGSRWTRSFGAWRGQKKLSAFNGSAWALRVEEE